MANYDLNTQQVKDNVQASSLSPSLKDAISNLLGNAADTTLDNLLAEPDTTVEIGRATGFALAEAGGKYTATSDTRVIIIEGDAPTELDVSIEDPSAQFVVVGGTGADAITLTDASVLASADGEVGVATIDGSDGDDLIVGSIGNDRLSGSNGNDTVSGGEGNDFIDGGYGNDSLSGNGGDDTIYGDEGNDFIDGGSGNDILNGSDGHDTFSGGEGNDFIDGGYGDDTASGGEGNDFIDGGGGTDTLLLAGRDARDYSFRFHNGNAVITHKDGGTDGIDTVANVEMIRFTGADLRADAVIGRLYEALLNREADQDGKHGWVQAHESGLSTHDIAHQFLESAEAKLLQGEMSDVEYVNMLYTTALDRGADREGLIGWTKALETGSMDRADVLLSFVNSAEKLSLEPVVEMDFNRSEAATLIRMYESLFNRAPDEGGINSYLEALESGVSLHDVALSFVNSAEAEQTYGSMSNIEFIDKLYSSTLDRTADVGSLIKWTKALENGSMDRADVLLSFADSTEKIELMGVVNTTIHHDV
jgi:hypothetical protein